MALADQPTARTGGRGRPLFEGSEWNFDLLKTVHDAIEEIAVDEMGLDIYANQIEVITAEQMLDAYSSIGMPLMYRHWSFGKRFAHDQAAYRKGYRSLAFEIVINSDPCISYVMEENSITMQTLVLAHAAFGHNHFFKNNYQFRQWTQADHILDYLAFAKAYVSDCEERYGQEAVETILDSAHALMNHGISRQIKPRARNAEKRDRERAAARRQYEEETYDDLWRTLPQRMASGNGPSKPAKAEHRSLGLPEENLLYFLEKNAPKLQDWQRELIRIVRSLAQYFYPQRQTKVMNEGCATFVHYEIMNRMYERGQLTEGSMLEFLHSHSSVVFQPDFHDPRFSGMNPYALGFAMMRDIQRMCTDPTEEDRHWFPDVAGNGKPLETLKEAWQNYRDESFVLQYLSPKVMRDFHLFALNDKADNRSVKVTSIHDERGYRDVRRRLAAMYDVGHQDADLQVIDADLKGSRRLVVAHYARNGILLDKAQSDATLQHLTQLWGYRVKLIEIDPASNRTLREHECLPMP
ncbi:MAG: SpoVR family protein [Pseudomonadota bacterium]